MSIVERAADLSGYSIEDIRGPSRLRSLCIVRWAVMLAFHRRGMPASSIGRILHRNHSTVFSGLRRAVSVPEAVAMAEKLS